MNRSLQFPSYLKKYYKKRIIKKQFFYLFDYYTNLVKKSLNSSTALSVYTNSFFLTLPKRQQCFSVVSTKTSKQLNFTSGKLLRLIDNQPKYFKKSSKNLGSLVMLFKKFFLKKLNFLLLFNIKNYNKRQHSFLYKFNETIHPNICYLIHKKSYVPNWQPKKRIKRTILRLLNKN